MSEPVVGVLLIALMFVLFAMGLEIAVSLGLVGVLGLLWLKGFTVGLGVVGSIAAISYHWGVGAIEGGAWYPAGPRPNVRVRVLCQPHGIATRPPPGIPFMTATLRG